MRILLYCIYILTFAIISKDSKSDDHKIPNLVGTWEGVNKTLSELRGYKTWEKKVEIIDKNKIFKSGNQRLSGFNKKKKNAITIAKGNLVICSAIC